MIGFTLNQGFQSQDTFQIQEFAEEDFTMNKRILTLPMSAFVLLFCISAAAQTKPDFAGTWKQDNSRSTVRQGSTTQYSNKIEHHDPSLTVTTIFSGSSRPDSSFTRTYTTDGKPAVSKDREGDEFTTTVKWKGNALVFETTEKEGGGEVKTIETWTLSEDGKTLTKVLHTTGPRGESDRKYVLEKQ